MGILGAFFVGRVLDSMGYPLNFATLFLVAAVFMGISWIGLALNREPESPIVKEHIPFSHYFRRLPAILRGNRQFPPFPAKLFHQPPEHDGRRLFHRIRQ